MAINLEKRNEQGTALTWVQVDGNWSAIEAAINALQARAGASVSKTLVAGDNVVNHNLAAKARFVTFFLENGTQVSYEWRRDPADQLNKIIVVVPADTPARELANTEINFIAI